MFLVIAPRIFLSISYLQIHGYWWIFHYDIISRCLCGFDYRLFFRAKFREWTELIDCSHQRMLQFGRWAILWNLMGGGNPDSVILTLEAGFPNNLHRVLVIARMTRSSFDWAQYLLLESESVFGNAYTWTSPKSVSLGSDYILQLSSDSDSTEINYSGYFSIANFGNSASSSALTSRTDSTLTTSAFGTNESAASVLRLQKSVQVLQRL